MSDPTMYEPFMRAAVALAERGRWLTCPNPTVGAVLVRDGQQLAEGWHHACGEAHAEVDCLRDAAEKGVDLLVAIGDDAVYYAEGAREKMGEEAVMFFPTKERFTEVMDSVIKEGDVILVKASRGMEMEKIVNEIIR